MDTNSSFTISDQTCQRFSFSQIQFATNNFDESLVIGRGGFGMVYKCSSRILSVNDVAIKRLHSMSDQGSSEFEAEVHVLSKLRHGNLVSLIGYCNERKELVLIYEFMPNGNLEDHLQKADADLSWLQRLKICIGAARGLDYLHTGTSTQHGVIHHDVKTSNILLDANFAAKISDFGLAKVSPINQTATFVNTGVKGTFGYLDPFYFYSGKLTRKSDVYAFGVVLFEVLSGKKAVDPTIDEDQWSLAAWAQDQIKDGKLNQIIDYRLIGQASKKCLKEFASLAGRCLQYEPKHRPSMAEVVVKLEYLLSKEKGSANFGFHEGRVISTITNFFKSKTDTMPAPTDQARKFRIGGFRNSTSVDETGFDVAYMNNEFEMGSGPKRFSYRELAQSTCNFAEHQKLREGGFGCVYRGFLKDSNKYIAVKRWSKSSSQGIKEYASEVRIISRLRHRNLVQLTGWCHEKGELLLVYEYMENESLDSHLFREKSLLTWRTRYKIAHGLASALLYLHEEWEQCVLHRDIKPGNVMLDSNFNAKLGDFGLAKLVDHERGSETTTVVGTCGYLAPEYFLTGKASKETDVYSFGGVILEIACGRRSKEYRAQEKQISLIEWVWELYGTGTLLEAVDPRLGSDFEEEEMKRLMIVGLWCVHADSKARPTMRQVIQVLTSEASLPMLPSDMPVASYMMSSTSSFCNDASITAMPSTFSFCSDASITQITSLSNTTNSF